jgi:hypothetical protein
MRVAGRSGAALVLATILTGSVAAQDEPGLITLLPVESEGIDWYTQADGFKPAWQGGIVYRPTSPLVYDPSSNYSIIQSGPQTQVNDLSGTYSFFPHVTEPDPSLVDIGVIDYQPQSFGTVPLASRPWAEIIKNLNDDEWTRPVVTDLSSWIKPTPEEPRFGDATIQSYLFPGKQLSYDSFVVDATDVLSANETLLAGVGTRGDFGQLAIELDPVVEANPRWGAVFAVELLENSPDLLRELDAPEWQGLIRDLEIAHELRNPTATAMLGESYLLGRGVEINQQLGLNYLGEAVAASDPRAMTLLGYYGYGDKNIMSPEAAVQLSLRALASGDANAGQTLGTDAFSRGAVNEGVDYYATTQAWGTGAFPARAQAGLAAGCGVPQAVCQPLTVAVATSREPGSIEPGLPWLDTHTGGYAPNFAFARAIVPFERDELGGEPPPPGFFEGLLAPLQADQMGRSTFLMPETGLATDQQFYDGIAQELASAEDDRLLLYVHGFNNSVEDALLAMARLKQRGQLPGIPLIYSWAAGDGLARANIQNLTVYSGYSRDVQVASNSCVAFSSFLSELSDRFGANRIMLVAHSHGAKLVHAALTGCEFRSGTVTYAGGPFDSVVYAAPDIDLDQFDQSFKVLASMARRVAIYVSDRDDAIKASSNLIRGGLPRLGGASRIDFGEGIEVINASSITDPSKDSGHSYALTNFLALTDMRRFLNGEVAADRCLEPINGSGPGWWLPECD